MFGFGNMFPHDIPRTFNTKYRAYSVSMMSGNDEKALDYEKGGKIIMPPSALDQLTRLNIQYPMLFKLTNSRHDRITHCGVLEFLADEGRIYLPYWMMRNLLLDEGSLVQVESISLPVATFAKFQPQSTDFLDITNPKAVLENALRNYACLTVGDMLAINYNEKIYELCVLDTQPGNAVSIIETDMNVDFAPPVGYQDPTPQRHVQHSHTSEDEPMPVDASEYLDQLKFRAFSGQGNRLDGKDKNTESSPLPIQPHEMKRGIPNYDYQKGTITFIRGIRTPEDNPTEEKNAFEAFSGAGHSLRKKQTRK